MATPRKGETLDEYMKRVNSEFDDAEDDDDDEDDDEQDEKDGMGW